MRRWITYWLLAAALLCAVVAAGKPAHAVPAFSRMYHVPCQTCHTVAPSLNASGRAFQANLFRWASEESSGGIPKQHNLLALPISAIATFDTVKDVSRHVTSHYQFETLELFASDSLIIDTRRNGGYFVNYVAAIQREHAGDLNDAWVALPIAGKRGQVAMTAGQFSPMMYQYDPVNSLTESLPVGLSLGTDGIAFTAPTPGLRLDYFDNRGKGTADGNYLAIGVPWEGHLTLNDDSRLYDSRGVFLHGFRRQGKNSLGLFGYLNGGRRQIGILGTMEATPNLNLLAAAATAKDTFGNSQGLSLEANWIATPNVAVTGRLESIFGFQKDTYPVAAVTYYPFYPPYLRLSIETVQQKSNRQVALSTYLLF